MIGKVKESCCLFALIVASWSLSATTVFAQTCPEPGVDADADGVCDDVDNCLGLSNPDQADTDGDRVGDACDGCPDDAGKTEPGVCGCGVPDDDTDEDTVADCNDNCPADANTDQADADFDGVGDVCDDCALTDLSETVVIDGCETGVPNEVLSGGCSFMDAIALCAEGASNHGKFVSCVGKSSKSWVKAGEISNRQRSRIVRCAAQADTRTKGK